MKGAPLLNMQLIRDRRVELRLSVRDIAKQLGVSITTVANLETGRAHGEQPLSLLFRLAEVLAMDVTDLLASPRPDEAAGADDDLVAKVSSVLFELRHLTSPEILATALNVTTGDVEAAVTVLDRRVAKFGLRVHRLRGDVGIVRSQATPTRDELHAAWQQDFARRSMTLSQARMLYRVWLGGFEQKQLSNPERVTLGQLINAGLVETPVEIGANTVVLTADVRASLGTGG